MCTSDLVVEHSKDQKQDRIVRNNSILLELSAADDLEEFRFVIEQEGYDVDETGMWYGRSLGSKKMSLEERTPLMIASIFGSKRVLKFILGLNGVDVNKACGSDKATALHLAVLGGSSSCIEVIQLLIHASADVSCLDVHGNRPVDLIPFVFSSSLNPRRKFLELLLHGSSDIEEFRLLSETINNDRIIEQTASVSVSPVLTEKKEYPVDLSLPDMKNGVYNTDEFRMYTFKIKPCSRAYSHDWTECPFVHPGENARRRDPRKYHYSCVPCPEFRKGSCVQGDSCEYAHGIFECWLHPAQYRTRLCKDEVGCTRKVCFFAHKPEELRPLHPSTGSAVLSPRSLSFSSSESSLINPFSSSTPPITPGASSPRGGHGQLWSNQSSPSLKTLSSRFKTTNSRDLDLEAELIMVDQYRQQQFMDTFNNSTRFHGDYFEKYGIPTGSNTDPNILSQLHGLSLEARNMNYSSGLSSSPLRVTSSSLFGVNQALTSRSTAFAKRSQSFIDRGTGFSSPGSSIPHSKLSDWGSPDGKLNWGIQKEDINKFRKSASFGVRTNGSPDYSSSIGNNQDFDLPFSVNNARKPGSNIAFDEEYLFSPWMDQDHLVA